MYLISLRDRESIRYLTPMVRRHNRIKASQEVVMVGRSQEKWRAEA